MQGTPGSAVTTHAEQAAAAEASSAPASSASRALMGFGKCELTYYTGSFPLFVV